jgi:NAD-dependent dihydropyrimidine dehydrogenase PreA subunit
MATMITNDCINCGACEPECPNNAISQGETIFVIDPQLCTECVGFHDYEACAAVCPVDCCVTDPNNIESEEALVARARMLHPETPIGDNFESRFRKGQGKPSAATPQPQAKSGVVAAAASSTRPSDTAIVAGAPTGPSPTDYGEPQVNFVSLPEIDAWEIPVRCFKCHEVHVEPVRNFMIGNVIFCPHCNKSMVVRDNLNYHLHTFLKESYEKWQKEQREFLGARENELAEFIERRAKEAKVFEAHQQRELQVIRQQLEALGENYDAPGKPLKKGTRFGWG